MSSSFNAPPVPPSDEIDLVALFQAVWQQKVLIVIVTALVGAMAAAYAFFATPEYQVSSVLRPAAINELDALNRSEIYGLPPGEALIRVGASLESYDTRLSFFGLIKIYLRHLSVQEELSSRVLRSSIVTRSIWFCLILKKPTP